jgi:hypothetical protein
MILLIWGIISEVSHIPKFGDAITSPAGDVASPARDTALPAGEVVIYHWRSSISFRDTHSPHPHLSQYIQLLPADKLMHLRFLGYVTLLLFHDHSIQKYMITGQFYTQRFRIEYNLSTHCLCYSPKKKKIFRNRIRLFSNYDVLS